MKRFARHLKRIDERLDLPQPERSRIILEIASDMEEMFRFYVARGLDEEEAARKSGEMFDLSDEALSQLVDIHISPFNRFFDKLSQQARTRWEKTMLAAVVLIIAALSGREGLSSGFIRQAGAFVWPVIGISFLACVMALVFLYRLYLRKARDAKGLRSGLTPFLMLGGASLVTGFFGLAVELYRAARAVTGVGDGALGLGIRWALTCSAMMMTSLLAAIGCGLIWFVLAGRVRSIEMAEAEWLLEE